MHIMFVRNPALLHHAQAELQGALKRETENEVELSQKQMLIDQQQETIAGLELVLKQTQQVKWNSMHVCVALLYYYIRHCRVIAAPPALSTQENEALAKSQAALKTEMLALEQRLAAAEAASQAAVATAQEQAAQAQQALREQHDAERANVAREGEKAMAAKDRELLELRQRCERRDS